MYLSFPPSTQATLARIIPTHETRTLVCRNNEVSRVPESLPLKAIPSALKVSTFALLHSHGSRNVHELGPTIEVSASKRVFASEEVR